MRLEHLTYLIALAQYGSINQASEKLHTSQQNLSRVLKQLESELGTVLFSRTYQGIALTTNGQKALAVALEIVPKIDHLKEQCMAEPPEDTPVGEVRLLCAPASIFTLIPRVLAPFQISYPQIKLTIEEMEAGEIAESIAKDPSLVGIYSIFINHKTPPRAEAHNTDLRFEALFVDRAAIFLSRDSPLARQKSVSMSSVIKHPLAMYLVGKEEDNHICTILREYGQPKLAFISHNMTLYMQAIAQGNCIGFTSNKVYQKHQFYNKDAMQILPIRDNMEFDTGLVTNKAFTPNSATKTVMDFIRSSVEGW